MNSCVFTGNMTRDGELKYLSSGTAVLKIGLAVNKKYKKGDEWKEKTSFLDFTIWGKRAESLAKYLTKGTKLAIRAEAEQNRWEDNNGNKRSKIEFRVEDLEFAGGGNRSGGGGNDYSSYEDSGGPENFEDDIPF